MRLKMINTAIALVRGVFKRIAILDLSLRYMKLHFGKLHFFLFYYRPKKVDYNYYLFESFQGRQISDSPLAIYSEIQESRKIICFWVVDATNFKNRTVLEFADSHKNVVLVKYKSKEYYKAFAKAKYWFVNCRIPHSIIKNSNQVLLQCWHGTPIKRLGRDIEIDSHAQSSLSVIKHSYTIMGEQCDYFLSPSVYASSCFETAFGLNKSKILEFGYPRNVSLLNGSFSRDEIVERLGLDPSKKTILYAPTFRDDNFDKGMHYSHNILDVSRFVQEFSNDYNLLFRGHYYVRKTGNSTSAFIDVSSYMNVNDLFVVTDVLITDYSSLFIDFMVLDKPIILYPYDLDEYSKRVRGFYLDYEDVFTELICYDLDDVIRKLSVTEELKYFDYKKLKDKFCPYEDGMAAKRVVSHIISSK
ncbi:CDP-glycerol glycerophosphotransferase family protein [Enterovibrio norvegicus]|uniref:CDP-glycerol glycerophosphotransferase family protein n=1 Tax=Enterovibrio norvegicus TaxID=188144 RepID=UPI003D131622